MAEDFSTWDVGNDSPVWLKPRRLVWFIFRYRDGPGTTTEVLSTADGRRRYFPTKLAAELTLRRLARQGKLPPLVARPRTPAVP